MIKTSCNLYPDIVGYGITSQESKLDFANQLPEGEYRSYLLGLEVLDLGVPFLDYNSNDVWKITT